MVLLKAVGFGIILFCVGFILYTALRHSFEKQPWHRRLVIWLLPADFKDDKKVMGDVAAELEKIKEEVGKAELLRIKKADVNVAKKDKKIGGKKHDGTGRVRGKEDRPRKFYEGKKQGSGSRGTCELAD